MLAATDQGSEPPVYLETENSRERFGMVGRDVPEIPQRLSGRYAQRAIIRHETAKLESICQ